jgi:hypothetical protein
MRENRESSILRLLGLLPIAYLGVLLAANEYVL